MKKTVSLLMVAALALSLAACGGGSPQPASAAETTAQETSAAETTAAETTEAETEAEPEAADEPGIDEQGVAGKYLVYEYEAGGNKVSHDMLVDAGAGDTYLELKEDGTGVLNLIQSPMDITWGDGKIKVFGTSEYTYTVDGDTLYLDMQGVHYIMIREGADGAPAGDAAASGSGDQSAGSIGMSSDGIAGVYYLTVLGDMTIGEFAEMLGQAPEELCEMIMVELKDDGSMTFTEEGEPEEGTYTIDGSAITLEIDGETMSGTIDGDTLTFDLEGETMELSKTKPGSGSYAGAGSTAEKADAAAVAAGTPDGVPGGDGLLSEEEVQKGYVWMENVAKDIFHTTYEELAEYFGVDGKFDKEEYSEHMKVNKRYYYWISKEDKNHFIYVNFEEDDPEGAPGVYTVSSYNSSGFTGSEAAAKYLDEVRAEATEADKAAAANIKMKDFSVDIHPWGDDDTKLSIGAEIPESGWAYDEQKDHLVENEDINTFGAGFIQFDMEDNVEDFDFYKDSFENYKEIDDREFDGVTFHGRTYKNIGYEWTEYIAQIDDGRALSIGIVRVDISEGTVGDKILKSITIK